MPVLVEEVTSMFDFGFAYFFLLYTAGAFNFTFYVKNFILVGEESSDGGGYIFLLCTLEFLIWMSN